MTSDITITIIGTSTAPVSTAWLGTRAFGGPVATFTAHNDHIR